MPRVSLKIVGASGQGINSIGEILAKGLKRSGYCVFGYREYPSLIKGGHASYQLDISHEEIGSTERSVDILVTLNHHGLQKNLGDLKEGGVIIHAVQGWEFSEEEKKTLRERRVRVIFLPVEAILEKLKAKAILGNVLISAFVWAILGREKDSLKTLVGERFKKKPQLLDLNMRCIEEGFGFLDPAGPASVSLPLPQDRWKECLLITGSQALGLGAFAAGVRFFAGYPMTPSTPLLTFMADMQNKTGIAIKQAEDEITAAQMVSGAMYAGTRAFTTTSGGGFDLMSETVSMNGIIENPVVFVVAQRPGPGTGLPTWTAQADLLMTVYTAHGEFPRAVIGVSGSADAFALFAEAFNLAEEYQIPVIVLTDKQLMEGLYTQEPFDASTVSIRRGALVTDTAALKKLSSTDRYDPSMKDGISPRWLPGSEAQTFCAQADEHAPDGSTCESAEGARLQIAKRLCKGDALKAALPEPELIGSIDPEILLVGWGSAKTAIADVLRDERFRGKDIGYLHYSYLWPLKTDTFAKFAKSAKKVVLIEGNAQGQLGKLLRQESGVEIRDKILKFDGRPFFYDELIDLLSPFVAAS